MLSLLMRLLQMRRFIEDLILFTYTRAIVIITKSIDLTTLNVFVFMLCKGPQRPAQAHINNPNQFVVVSKRTDLFSSPLDSMNVNRPSN